MGADQGTCHPREGGIQSGADRFSKFNSSNLINLANLANGFLYWFLFLFSSSSVEFVVAMPQAVQLDNLPTRQLAKHDSISF